MWINKVQTLYLKTDAVTGQCNMSTLKMQQIQFRHKNSDFHSH
ncbi:hypothetical protein J2X32_000649 [Rheinheimera pacifica]|nr:hypothetical protein [Rheinheimera pacifica]